MTIDRWPEVKALFEDLFELPPDVRAARLAARTDGDPVLRAEVESLIRASDVSEQEFERVLPRSLDFLRDEIREPAPSLEGRTVGNYVVARQVGHGGMGAIYEAYRADDTYRKRVAIKTIWRGADSDAIVRRFRTERQILAGLDHPNIAALLDGGLTPEGLPYFVMEFVDGEPIDRYCATGRLTIAQRIALVRQVCDAVQFAHRNLVVHRDIKPGNVLVTTGGVVKLLDFGIAKLIVRDDADAGGGGGTLTQVGLRPFTTAYASPEQLRGDTVSTATDVYSLGALLYELLTGRPPFEQGNRTPHQLMQAISDEAVLAPSRACTPELAERAGLPDVARLRRDLRGELDDIVRMALRKEPERRYASVDQLSEDLRRFIAHLPIQARPDTRRYRTTKFVRRNRAGAAAAMVAVLSLVGGVIATSLQARATARERDRAQAAADVAVRERMKAQRVSEFLQNILGAADASWYSGERPGPTSTIGSLLDDAGRRAREDLADQPDVQGAVLRTLGRANRTMARFDSAQSQLESALALHRAVGGDKSVDAADDLYQLGSLHYQRGNMARADTLYRQAMAAFRAAGDTLADGFRSTLNDHGILLLVRGQAAAAEPMLRQSGEMMRVAGADSAALAINLGNQGLALDILGKMDDAERVYQQALARFDRISRRDYYERGFTMHNLALIRMLRGDGVQAESLMLAATALWRKLLGDDHPNVVVGVAGLARVLLASGDLPRALAYAREADRLIATRLPPTHPEVARVDNVYGQILVAMGRLPEGERRLRHALEIRRRLTPNAWATAETASALGLALTKEHRYAEAEPLLRDGLDGLRTAFGPDHPRTVQALDNLISMYRSAGRTADAERLGATRPARDPGPRSRR